MTTDTNKDKGTERTLVLRISESDYRRFSVGRAKRGLKTAEYLHALLDMAEEQNPTTC